MSAERVERKLAAILAADVVGYSRLMGTDEEGTLAALKAVRRELADPKIAEHRGRIVKTTGDGLLVEFPSVVDAVRCAIEVQRAMAGRNAEIPVDKRLEFRIGIHQGDIIVDGDDIYGDGVNIAARLEALAEPGGIYVSVRVHEDVAGKIEEGFEDLGERSLKNMTRPVRVYRVRGTAEAVEPARELRAVATAPPSPSIHAPTISVQYSAQTLRQIGYLGVEPRTGIEEFKRRLAASGHVEGKTVQVHYRWSNGIYAKYPGLVQELTALGVEVIVAVATPAVQAAKQGARTIPIVMVGVGDPVGYGIVPSLMRPAGNITGVSNGLHESGPRGIRLLKEIIPEMIRVVVLAPASGPGVNPAVKSWEEVVHALGMIPRTYNVASSEEVRALLAGLDQRSCDALAVVPDHGLMLSRSIIIAATLALKIPLFCAAQEYVRDGGLMSLTPDQTEINRRVAYYVDAILKGTPPSELPIEEPSKWRLTINLNTAKVLGITIPEPILMRTDELIE